MDRIQRNEQIVQIYNNKRLAGYTHKHILSNILQPRFWLKPRTLHSIILERTYRNKASNDAQQS